MGSPVEDHDLVPSLSDNLKSQTHSRVSECDGQPSVQVEPSAVNSMVTASTGVQTDPKSSRNLLKWNFSVVLNELTQTPFEPIKDTDLKHLTLKTAIFLALAFGNSCLGCKKSI